MENPYGPSVIKVVEGKNLLTTDLSGCLPTKTVGVNPCNCGIS